jgi:acyl-coenzyme A thioesterase PaaI-like protein
MGSCGVTLDSVLVRVADSADIPFAQAGTDTAVCAGGQALLGGAPAPGLVYTWTPATGLLTPDSSATVADSAGTFVLTATNPLGTGACLTVRDTVRFVTPPASGFAGPDTLLCQGDSARIGLPLPPGWAALWTPADGIADPNALPVMAAPAATTSYALSVTDTLAAGACATASDTLLVTVEPPFDHPAPQDITYCPGEVLRVGTKALPGHTYAWTPPVGLQDPTASTTLVAPPPGGAAYTLTVTRLDLLSDCRELAFAVLLTDGGCLLQNVLTPNGDGVNDQLVLGPFAGPASLAIYDRWGARVYDSAAYGDDWEAQGLPDGVYYYVLLVDGRRVAGDLTVLR